VCMAVYNGLPHIREQVSSILEQLSDVDELVISDNGSTDGTLEYLTALSDYRIRLVSCDIQGVCANFESALMHSEGEYIFLSDQDDVWLSGRLDYGLRMLEDYDLSAVSLLMSSENSTDRVSIITPSGGFVRNLLKNSFPGCALCFRRAVLEWVIPFPLSLPMHDWWIVLMCLVKGKVATTAEVYISYRRHDCNASITGEKSARPIIQRILERGVILRSILLRLMKLSIWKKR